MKVKTAVVMTLVAGLLAALAACNSPSAEKAMTQEELIARGEHLVRVGDCGICHTPKRMTAQGPVEDSTLLFSGHQANDPIPEFPGEFIATSGWLAATNPNFTAWAGPWGISFAANLTPSQVYGCGAWTEESFIQAIRTGKHLGNGRPILPPMPWQANAAQTDENLRAMFAYFKSLKPIDNQVPQPVPPPNPPGAAPAN